MLGVMELVPVADPAPVVHTEHHVTLAREVLIDRVAVRVIIHVVPAEEHLARRPAVDEDDRGLPRGTALPLEELAVDGRTVRRGEDDLPRYHHSLHRKVRDELVAEESRRPPGCRDDGGKRWRLGPRGDVRDHAAVPGRDRCPFDAGALRERNRRRPVYRHTEEMA